MIDVYQPIVAKLKQLDLPVYHEHITEEINTFPCLTYAIVSDTDDIISDSLAYGRVILRVSVWGSNLVEILPICQQVDSKIKEYIAKRTGAEDITYQADEKAKRVLTYLLKTKEIR